MEIVPLRGAGYEMRGIVSTHGSDPTLFKHFQIHLGIVRSLGG